MLQKPSLEKLRRPSPWAVHGALILAQAGGEDNRWRESWKMREIRGQHLDIYGKYSKICGKYMDMIGYDMCGNMFIYIYMETCGTL